MWQLVEKLYRLKWGQPDGLGALIISPTRELAMQIFEELRKVGAKHDLSAGLLIGGKNVKEERDRVNSAHPTSLPALLDTILAHLIAVTYLHWTCHARMKRMSAW